MRVKRYFPGLGFFFLIVAFYLAYANAGTWALIALLVGIIILFAGRRS